MDNNNQPGNPQRRAFFRRSLPIIPVAGVAAAGGAAATLTAIDSNHLPVVPGPAVNTALRDAAKYQPTYFSADEYRFLQAAVARLIPRTTSAPARWRRGCPSSSTAR